MRPARRGRLAARSTPYLADVSGRRYNRVVIVFSQSDPRTELVAYRDALQRALNEFGTWPSGDYDQVRVHYLRTIDNAERLISTAMPTTTRQAVFQTPREQLVRAGVGTAEITRLAQREFDSVRQQLTELSAIVQSESAYWQEQGDLYVPDTNWFLAVCRDARGFSGFDFHASLDTTSTDITLVVPICVVDELDNLKHASNRDVRTQARLALRGIDFCSESPGKAGSCPTTDAVKVRVAVMLDARVHHRLPVADDEIVGRAAALQTAVGPRKPVRVLSFDTGFRLRARAAGLEYLTPRIFPIPATSQT